MEQNTNDKLLTEIIRQIEKMENDKLERLAAFIAGLEAAGSKTETPNE